MAATSFTTDWAALAKKLWPGAIVHGTGHHAVVVRCQTKAVHLFDDYKAARDFEAGNCSPDCARKHTWGSLVPYIPAPPPMRGLRNLGLLERE